MPSRYVPKTIRSRIVRVELFNVVKRDHLLYLECGHTKYVPPSKYIPQGRARCHECEQRKEGERE